MAPLAHAEGYLGPPEGYPTGGHSLPLAPRGEVGDRQRSTSEHRGSCKKSEWGRRDGGSGNTDDPCRPPGGSPAVAADVIQQRCACVVSMALCDRGATSPLPVGPPEWGTRRRPLPAASSHPIVVATDKIQREAARLVL